MVRAKSLSAESRQAAAVVTIQPIRVATGTDDREGYLVLEDAVLAGVIVRLDDPMHGDNVGKWFLEACFGPHCRRDPVFPSLEQAVNWFHERGSSGRA